VRQRCWRSSTVEMFGCSRAKH